MVSSEVEICNLGLIKLGYEGVINSLDEGSKGARVMNAIYEPMRDAVLSRHLWKFARKRAVLAPLTEEPVYRNHTGENYFQYPDDCLRIVGTDKAYFETGYPWAREGNKIIAPTTTLKLVYLEKIQDVSRFDPNFVDAFACRLAMEAAMPILQDKQMRDMMRRDYKASVIEAAHCSAVEQDGEKFIAEAFLGAR